MRWRSLSAQADASIEPFKNEGSLRIFLSSVDRDESTPAIELFD
ncbi:hypothetical protein [Chamaesiphon polymorphus]|nr:hypothetical protein [Chamaesiphon polymorphus]